MPPSIFFSCFAAKHLLPHMCRQQVSSMARPAELVVPGSACVERVQLSFKVSFFCGTCMWLMLSHVLLGAGLLSLRMRRHGR